MKPTYEPTFTPKVVGETTPLPAYLIKPERLEKRPDQISKIEPHEEKDAIDTVRNAFKVASGGKDYTARTTGYNITVKLHIRPEELKRIKRDDGSEVTLYLPDTARADDAYNTAVGLVIDVGEDAYQGETITGKKRFREPWCKVGDFIVFKRTDPIRVNYKGVALSIMTDDNVVMVIDDPSDVSIGQLEFRS